MDFSLYNSDQVDEIKQVFRKSFSDSEGEDEGILIGNLAYELITETPNEDFYCFVAIEDGQIIGSIIFSKLSFDNNIKAFLLSPVAIDTKHQGKGVGQKLIKFGLRVLKTAGVELVTTYGDPKFYEKVGFKFISEEVVKPPMKLTYPEGWLAQSLIYNEIKPVIGNSYCVEAFKKPDIW